MIREQEQSQRTEPRIGPIPIGPSQLELGPNQTGPKSNHHPSIRPNLSKTGPRPNRHPSIRTNLGWSPIETEKNLK